MTFARESHMPCYLLPPVDNLLLWAHGCPQISSWLQYQTREQLLMHAHLTEMGWLIMYSAVASMGSDLHDALSLSNYLHLRKNIPIAIVFAIFIESHICALHFASLSSVSSMWNLLSNWLSLLLVPISSPCKPFFFFLILKWNFQNCGCKVVNTYRECQWWLCGSSQVLSFNVE